MTACRPARSRDRHAATAPTARCRAASPARRWTSSSRRRASCTNGAAAGRVGRDVRHRRSQPPRPTGTPANVPLRGVDQPVLAVRHEVKIIDGRMLTFGTNEVVVGRIGEPDSSRGSTSASTIKSGQVSWQVVGMFEHGRHRRRRREIWCDVRIATGRVPPRQFVSVRAGEARLAGLASTLQGLAVDEPRSWTCRSSASPTTTPSSRAR